MEHFIPLGQRPAGGWRLEAGGSRRLETEGETGSRKKGTGERRWKSFMDRVVLEDRNI
ncbi:MAG: hypothetical protein HQ557_03670 [Bacteroidetes bacterium]|nr:hypothetical protein [Bacteroidota bacterium]